MRRYLTAIIAAGVLLVILAGILQGYTVVIYKRADHHPAVDNTPSLSQSLGDVIIP